MPLLSKVRWESRKGYVNRYSEDFDERTPEQRGFQNINELLRQTKLIVQDTLFDPA